MTTTAHEDQFTVAPEPVHQPYSTADILRRNVADLELALKQQTERAEAAEAELLAVRDDNHSMMLEIDGLRKELAKVREQEPVAYVKYKATGGNVGLSWFAIPTQVYYPREGEPLYVNPIPVPAPAVPSGWNIRRDGDVLIVQHPDIGGCSVQKEPDLERMIPEAILYSLADALLQSAEVTK